MYYIEPRHPLERDPLLILSKVDSKNSKPTMVRGTESHIKGSLTMQSTTLFIHSPQEGQKSSLDDMSKKYKLMDAKNENTNYTSRSQSTSHTGLLATCSKTSDKIADNPASATSNTPADVSTFAPGLEQLQNIVQASSKKKSSAKEGGK